MYILFDIGGTKTRIAASKDLGSFTEPIIFPTPQNFEEGIALIAKTVQENYGGEPVQAAAGGIAASPNREKTKLVSGGPNIADWINKPIKDRLSEALNAPVYIENDTAMGGLAQVHFGPAKGYEIAVYVTVSTGVGGCRFTDGKIDKSALGFEPGWQIIGSHEMCACSSSEEWLSGFCAPGFLMSHIGGKCVEGQEGKKPHEILDVEFWDKKARLLAYGLHNISTMWSPDIIVVGGSMMNKIGIPLFKSKSYLEETLKHVSPKMPEIVPADFGDEMGLCGAMAYLKQLDS